MNYTFNNVRLDYKRCAGKGCDRPGSTILKIPYINKIGLFCDCCPNDLIIQELAVKVGDDSK